jgi:hypothetical protein
LLRRGGIGSRRRARLSVHGSRPSFAAEAGSIVIGRDA